MPKSRVAKGLSVQCKVFPAFYSTFTADDLLQRRTFAMPMTAPEQFRRLKDEILSEYRKHFPYFTGNWKTFSSADIQNLIGLLEENQKETVSEKWIYTHLKPENNDKLPRKDMLDIFCRFCGYSGWDEFVFQIPETPVVRKKNYNWLIVGIVAAVGILILVFWPKDKPHTIKVTDQYTGEPVDAAEIQIVDATPQGGKPVEIVDGRAEVPPQTRQLKVKGSMYPTQIVAIDPSADSTEIRVKPDDKAMMLKAFLKSDIKDWKTRQQQLDKILSDELEVIVMLKDNLGAEYFNKQEFSGKVIIPTPSLKKLKIIEIKYNEDQKIDFIRMAE